MPAEIFAVNRASTTVPTGGTTAPASGTSESWTVTSSASFPAASSTALLPTQFHVADPAQPTEMIAVTNVSGTTWTVTRGAEGTTPVAHVAGFTIYQVVTAGAYTGFLAFGKNGNAEALNTGEFVINRLLVTDQYSSLTAGTLQLTYWTAAKTESCAHIDTFVRGVNGNGMTYAGIGVYSVAGNGGLTLLNSTGNVHTTLWTTTYATSSGSLTTPFAKVAGTSYALGFLPVGGTAPTLSAASYLIGTPSGSGPFISGTVSGQSTLPSIVTAGSISEYYSAVGAVVRP